jgi:hypothetical protein
MTRARKKCAAEAPADGRAVKSNRAAPAEDDFGNRRKHPHRELSGSRGLAGQGHADRFAGHAYFFLFSAPQWLGWLVFNEQYLGLSLWRCALVLLILPELDR